MRRFIVVHVSGETETDHTEHGEAVAHGDPQSQRAGGNLLRTPKDRKGTGVATDERSNQALHRGEGRWELDFLRNELRDICLRKLEIPVNTSGAFRFSSRSFHYMGYAFAASLC